MPNLRAATLFKPNKVVRDNVLQYSKAAYDSVQTLESFRQWLVLRDKIYQRQLDTSREHVTALLQNRMGDARKLKNLTVPIALPQVESAVAYQAGVFLTDWPVFGVVSDPAQIDAANMFETALGTQQLKFGWPREITKSVRNGFRYNFGPTVCRWDQLPSSKIVNDLSVKNASEAKVLKIAYEGNLLKSIDPYNCFMPFSVEPSQLHCKGEFFGYNELENRMSLLTILKKFNVPTAMIEKCLNTSFETVGTSTGSANSGRGYYIPDINPWTGVGRDARAGQTDWSRWFLNQSNSPTRDVNYKNNYLLTHMYFRQQPHAIGRPGFATDDPTIYYALIVNWQEVAYMEEIASSYNYLPVVIAQGNDTGLGWQDESMLDISGGFQDMGSALWNMSLEAARRNVFDRLVYNPKFINKEDIDPARSVQRIPLRNAAQNIENAMQRAIYQIPFRQDNMAANIQMAEQIGAMADVANGQNKVDRGQFQKGNKSVPEFQTTMANSSSRQQLTSIGLEYSYISPMKEMIKDNTLMYGQNGSFYNYGSGANVDINMVAIREASLQFKVTDGLLPADKLLNPELMQIFLQFGMGMPAIATEYDMLGMFLYYCKSQGAKWVNDFKRNPQAQKEFLGTVAKTSAAQNVQLPTNRPESNRSAA